MKLTIFIIASILLISLIDLPTGSACLVIQPVTCTKAPTKPPKTTKPAPCSCGLCGPGGTPCNGCPSRDKLCEKLLKLLNDLDSQIRQCVCGEKKWLLQSGYSLSLLV